MTPETKAQVLTLIEKLALTKSTNAEYDLVVDFCFSASPEFQLSQAEIVDLIGKVKAQKDEHSSRGTHFAKKKSNHKFDFPGFFEPIKNDDALCRFCHTKLGGEPGFVWKQGKDKWSFYCPDENCFPRKQSQRMKTNTLYRNWCKKTAMVIV